MAEQLPHAPHAGEDLRITRLAARVTQRDVASAYGCSLARIQRIEQAAGGHLRATTVDRYLGALDRLARP